MRFMMMIKADRNYEAGAQPDPKLDQAIGRHIEEMTKAGVLLDVGGLLPTSAGARIKAAAGKLTVIDGPFAEAKEVIGGYAILQAKSKAEAIEHGKRFMSLHVSALGAAYAGELELRQLFDPADFAPQG